MRQAEGVPRHRERLVAPPAWWVGAAVFALVCGWIVYVAATPTLAVVAAAAGALVAAASVWSYGSVLLVVDEAGVQVGRARLDPTHVGAAEALGPAELRERLGPRADARAWLMTRPYVDRGVALAVDDPTDPTPYWLVSSRRPEAFVAAVDELTGRGGTTRSQEDTDGQA